MAAESQESRLSNRRITQVQRRIMDYSIWVAFETRTLTSTSLKTFQYLSQQVWMAPHKFYNRHPSNSQKRQVYRFWGNRISLRPLAQHPTSRATYRQRFQLNWTVERSMLVLRKRWISTLLESEWTWSVWAVMVTVGMAVEHLEWANRKASLAC